MNSWGWRVPFLVAGPLGLVGMYLRSKMEDTPVFRELEQKTHRRSKARGRSSRRRHGLPAELLKLSGLVIALNVVNYTLLSYSPTYLKTHLNLDSRAAHRADHRAVGDDGGARVRRRAVRPGRPQAGVARVADRPHRARDPALHAHGHGSGRAIVAFAILGLLYTPQLATISATFPAMFPAQVRYAALAISYNVARPSSAARRRWSTRASSRAPAISCGPPTT